MPNVKPKVNTLKGHSHKRKARFRLNKRGKKLASLLLLVLFAGIFAFSAVKLIGMVVKYRAGRAVYADIAEEGVEFVPSEISDEREETEPETLEDGLFSIDEEIVFDEVSVTEPDTEEEISGALPWEREERIAAVTGISVKWDQLRKKNKDVAAWLYMPDSNINYPVMLTDNNEYYLDHNFNRKEDESGALFFDCRNDLDGRYENIIIYGHRRNDRSMFGNIARYSKEEYLQAHPVMYLVLPDRAYKVEVFACRTVHALSKFFLTSFGTQDEFRAYIENALNGSYWASPVPVEGDGPILTLATCSTYVRDDDPRLLVHGKMTLIK